MANLDLIKKIREATGAGMVDVKEALAEAKDNEAKAIELLRKKGQKIAAKRAERVTKEGFIAS
jgi:elongation factor Ts